MAFEKYEILCLNPTPAPLKILSRVAVRDLLNHDETKIEQLKSRIPVTLFNFLSYPRQLYSGEYMIVNEKLVSECGNYELVLDKEHDFICRNKKDNTELYKLFQINSIFLHYSLIACCFEDEMEFRKFYQIHNDKKRPCEYRVKLMTSENSSPYLLIEILGYNGSVYKSLKHNFVYSHWRPAGYFFDVQPVESAFDYDDEGDDDEGNDDDDDDNDEEQN